MERCVLCGHISMVMAIGDDVPETCHRPPITGNVGDKTHHAQYTNQLAWPPYYVGATHFVITGVLMSENSSCITLLVDMVAWCIWWMILVHKSKIKSVEIKTSVRFLCKDMIMRQKGFLWWAVLLALNIFHWKSGLWKCFCMRSMFC